MDNIILEKVWQDGNLIELKVFATSKFISTYQSCYVSSDILRKASEKICKYICQYNNNCYIEFGCKEGNYTPAFSIDILPADKTGHTKIEADIEIADNDTRSHRCCFYINSEIGLVERFGMKIKELVTNGIGAKAALYE